MIKSVFILSTIEHKCSEHFDAIHSLVRGFIENDITVFATSTCKYVTHHVHEKDIVKIGKMVDLIILKYALCPHINEPITVLGDGNFQKVLDIKRAGRTIYIDHFERSWTNKQGSPFNNTFLKEYCLWYGKRECYPQFVQEGFVPFHLDFSTEDTCPITPKTIDIFCAFGHNTTGLRSEAILVCKKLQAEGYRVVFGPCPREQYIDNIRKSFISIDCTGGGEINHRFFEIVSNRCLCFRQKYNIVMADDYDDSMIVEFNTSKDLYNKLKLFLNNPNKERDIIRMANKAYDHYYSHHDPKNAVKRLLRISEDKIRENEPDKPYFNFTTYTFPVYVDANKPISFV